MKTFPAIFVLTVTCGAQAPSSGTIHRDELKADLYFLASDALRGRLTNTPEYNLAANWIEARFERLGLKPLRGDSYFQAFSLSQSRIEDGNRLSIAPVGGASLEARVREDFYPLIFSANAGAHAEAVFAGYGIDAPEHGWDDYGRVSVKGRIALVLTGEPGANDPKSPFDGLVTSEHAGALRKTLAAQKHGAVAVLFVSAASRVRGASRFAAAARNYWPDKPARIPRYTLTSMAERVRIPTFEISPSLADTLLAGASTNLAAAAEAAGKGAAHAANGLPPLSVQARIASDIVEDRNVVAMIEGSDPKIKDEAVLISAHYDHNGADETRVFNGADDNASGTVALLEIAEAYTLAARAGQRPRRTVIFAAWGSEERCCGPLLGSWAWTEHPLWPLEKTVAALNMDMIGRSEDVPDGRDTRFNGLRTQTAASNSGAVNILGYSYSPDLTKSVQYANRNIDLVLRLRYDNNRSNLLRRSDQWPFLQRGVPALFFHTGLHPDYHTANDRPERIDYAKLERIARLVHQLSWDLANTESRPVILRPRPIPEPD